MLKQVLQCPFLLSGVTLSGLAKQLCMIKKTTVNRKMEYATKEKNTVVKCYIYCAALFSMMPRHLS